jgi:hypothetical protein
MDRLRAWLVVAPLVAAGILVTHAVAYRLTATPVGSLHAYLEHAPQLILLVSVLAIALAGLGARLQAPPAWAFAALAPLAFLVQEHVERLVHTGQLPWLVTTPAVALGLVLQVPVAIVVWLVARRLLRALAPAPAARSRGVHALVALAVPVVPLVAPVRVRALPARGPPSLLRP